MQSRRQIGTAARPTTNWAVRYAISAMERPVMRLRHAHREETFGDEDGQHER
jgi:hypothetical protein